VRRGPRLLSIYADIGRTWWAWMPSLVTLAVLIFVPLGALDALAVTVEVDSLNIANGIKLFAVMAAVGAIVTTSLLGEVFFSGVVAVSLTHPEHLNPPSLGTIARKLKYGRLIAVDILYVAMVALGGLVLWLVGSVIVFVWLGLAGPVVEIEERGVLGALRRSFQLVRGRFWTVLAVLVPIEVAGDAITGGIAGFVHHLFGHTFLASWLAESLGNVLTSPFFAVASVLLTLKLIEARDGSAPALHSAPVAA
jgi:hypothetical protein